ncbi:G-protein coupled receptor Mth2-like isoform X2 [Anticarsia gemmatalis]|uniref:G-protein coupled receptor Mth2-like isoform X2 n=1 Tax=Anticarsia gemmatalis TaxID=129554 RepID=UPI003F766581
MYFLTAFFSLVVLVSVEGTPCIRVQSLNITSGIKYENGSIVHGGIEYKRDTWYEVEEDGVLSLLGCPCIGRTCVHRCCSSGSAFFNTTCTATDLSAVNPFSPKVYRGREPSSLLAHEHFFYLDTRPCSDSYLVDSSARGEELYIQENGTLFEVAPGGLQWHVPTAYCVEMMINDLAETPRLVAGVCYPEEPPVNDDSSILYTAYAVGLLLSVPFLMATFLVYAFIPELRNLHGMCLMAYCGGLIIAYPVLAYLKLHTGRIGVQMTGCLLVAFIVYYAFQTSFFWLNVMCFDIWRTFSGYRGGSTNKRRDKRRFLMYGLYAWGVPLLLTALTAAMQFSDLPSNVIKPDFGTRRCWFVDWLSELVYFFSPVLVLVVCNVAFFTITAYRIRSIRQETAILKSSESSRSDKLKKDKQRFGLYLKLFMVMGVNWTVELISFVVGGSNWYWIVIDISNIGLGVFVFFIFVWKKKVRNLVRKRFNIMVGRPYSERDTRTGKWNTTSTAPTEDTRISTDDSALRLKDMH